MTYKKKLLGNTCAWRFSVVNFGEIDFRAKTQHDNII